MRHTRILLVALLLLGAVAVLAAASACADPADISNPPTSDWFFDSGTSVTIAGKVWDVHYNITVANYTHLVLDNCDFTFSDPSDLNPRWIHVWWNGSLTLSNCSFDSTGTAKYYLHLENNTAIETSTLTGMFPFMDAGIYANSCHLELTDSTITDLPGMHAIHARDCSITASGLTITGCGSGDRGRYGLYTYNSYDDDKTFTFDDCNFDNNHWVAVYMMFYRHYTNATVHFTKCSFDDNEGYGLYFNWERGSDRPMELVLRECSFEGNERMGLYFRTYRAYYGSTQGHANVTIDTCNFEDNEEGGAYLYCYYSDLHFMFDIDDCTFRDNGMEWSPGGLYIYAYRVNGWWRCNVDDCTFDTNARYGLRFEHASVAFDGSYLAVNDSKFDDNAACGLSVQMWDYYDYITDLWFDNCSFTDNVEAGIHIFHDRFMTDYSLTVVDCSFTGIEGGGILSESPSWNTDENTGVVWDVSDTTFMNLGDTAVLMHLDGVAGDDALMLENVTFDHTGGVQLMIDNSRDTVEAHHTLSVKDVQFMTISGSAIDAMVNGYFGVAFDVHLEDVTVDDALYNGIRAMASTVFASATRSIGMDIDVMNVVISNVDGNGMNLGTDRIDYRGTREIDVKDLDISSVKKGVTLSGLKGEFRDTMITDSENQEFVVITSDLELYEPELDALTEDTVQVIESGSVKFWFRLKVNVLWDTGIFVEGAVVEVMDNHQTLIGGYTQMDDSGLPELLLNSFQFRETGLFTRSPYAFRVAFRDIEKRDSVQLDATKVHNITLADHMPPSIFINSPAPDHVQQSKVIKVRGSSFDGESGVKMVEVSIDGVNWEQMDNTTRWDHSFTVSPEDVKASGGVFIIRARATDEAGNNRTTITKVTIDPFPPELVIDFPWDKYRTNEAMLTVRGVTEARATVLVNGMPTQLSGTLFNTKVALVEGPNTITVSSSDALGNMNTIKMEVILDTKPPYVVLLTPAEDEMFTDPTIDVSGQAEDGLTIMVNGFVLSEAQYNNGTFSYAQAVKRGENTVWLVATDEAGNRFETTRTIWLDDEKPVLSISEPEDGAHFKATSFMVVGTTDTDAILLINDEQITLDHGLFRHHLVGVEGENSVIVTAMDVAGNTVTVELTVHVDTQRPGLDIEGFDEDIMVTTPSYTLSGTATGAKHVKVNGVEYPVDQDQYNFSVDLSLLEGANLIKVVAEDEAGNTFATEGTVFLDTRSPILVVRVPGITDKNVFFTDKGEPAVMRVIGYTDDAVQVLINGDAVAIREDGYFEFEYSLTVGASNTVTVIAKDGAANERTETITVDHKVRPGAEDEGFEWGWLILFVGLIILIIAIALGYLLVTRAEPVAAMPEPVEEEVLVAAELPEVEEEEEEAVEEEEPEEEEPEEEEEEDLEVEVEEEEEEEKVFELTPPSQRPKTEGSRPGAAAAAEAPLEEEDKDLEDRDADADIGADESDQEEGI